MPVTIKVTPRGFEQALFKLASIGRNSDMAMQQAGEDSLNFIFDNVPGYPGAPATSAYARTGDLGGSVKAFAGDTKGAMSKVEPAGKGVDVLWSTGISYANYVIGYQAWMHKGRWWTMAGVWGKVRGGINGIWRAMVGKLIRGEI